MVKSQHGPCRVNPGYTKQWFSSGFPLKPADCVILQLLFGYCTLCLKNHEIHRYAVWKYLKVAESKGHNQKYSGFSVGDQLNTR